MIEKAKESIAYYNKWFEHGTLVFIAINIARIILFPVMLLRKLYRWVYGYD